MRYVVEFDRFPDIKGGCRYWAEARGDLWPLIIVNAERFKSLYFSITDVRTNFTTSGGVLCNNFCLFQIPSDAGYLTLFSSPGSRDDEVLIDIIDRRHEVIFFIPKYSFLPYDQFKMLAEKVFISNLPASYKISQFSADIGIPAGANAKLLSDQLISSDLSDDELLPGRWEMGLRRVTNSI